MNLKDKCRGKAFSTFGIFRFIWKPESDKPVSTDHSFCSLSFRPWTEAGAEEVGEVERRPGAAAQLQVQQADVRRRRRCGAGGGRGAKDKKTAPGIKTDITTEGRAKPQFFSCPTVKAVPIFFPHEQCSVCITSLKIPLP